MEIIEFKDFSSFKQTISLDNRVYNFRFYWNKRSDSWHMDISDASGISIILGIKIVNGWELISRYAKDNLPPGRLFAVSKNGSKGEVSRGDFIDNFNLVYVTESELG